MNKTKTTTVRLLSHTAFPIETIYVEWLQSRSEGYVPDPGTVRAKIDMEKHRAAQGVPHDAGAYEDEVMDVFEKVIAMKIPVAETVDFVFLLEHCPIALREQIVRHRIGHRYGGRLGADIVPDLAESTFWSQTTRVLNMGKFATEGEYLLPESVTKSEATIMDRGSEISIEEFYCRQMGWLQSAYNRLVAAGIPAEDARNLLPLGVQHRLTWKLNLSALLHVLSKRGCWIAQLGMWEPVIRGIVEELATKIHPVFRKLIDPPCFAADGNFNGCVFKLENENRVRGDDPYAPCPLYLHHHGDEASKIKGPWEPVIDTSNGVAEITDWSNISREKTTELTVRGARYRELWGRNEWTGAKLQGGVATETGAGTPTRSSPGIGEPSA